MPRSKRKTHFRRRGYRKLFTKPKKCCRPYKGNANNHKLCVCSSDIQIETDTDVDTNNGFCGFDIPPASPARVVSLFDGLGSALCVLDTLKIKVEAYFSSEVDEKALQLLKYKYFDRITPVGAVEGLSAEKLAAMGRVDLLLAGSPCSDFSLVNPRREGLKGEQGKLFFEFLRVLKILTTAAKTNNHKFFWLFENVCPMEECVKEAISKHLGCEPIMRCASMYVPMKRKRYFWGNIIAVNMETCPTSFNLQHFLMPYRSALVQMAPTLTTTLHSQHHGKGKDRPVLDGDKEDHLLITEMEALFGFPAHYTDGPNLSITDRRQLLGRAWSIPVVTDILKCLRSSFLTRLD